MLGTLKYLLIGEYSINYSYLYIWDSIKQLKYLNILA